MKKSNLEKHIESVTPDALRDHLDTFTLFASATGVNGRVQIGHDGTGAYIVKINDIKYKYPTFWPKTAISRYKELLTEKINSQ